MADPTLIAAAVSTPDYTALTVAIGAAAVVVIGAIVNGIIAIGAARDNRETKQQMTETAKAVDGKMTAIEKLIREQAKAEGKEEERTEAAARQGVADAAVLKELAKAPVVTPAVAADSLTGKESPK